MTTSSDNRETPEERRERLLEVIQVIGQVGATAEVWPPGGDGDDIDEARVVDVVRVDDHLHFVVVVDG